MRGSKRRWGGGVEIELGGGQKGAKGGLEGSSGRVKKKRRGGGSGEERGGGVKQKLPRTGVAAGGGGSKKSWGVRKKREGGSLGFSLPQNDDALNGPD